MHNIQSVVILQVRVVLQGVDKHENLIASVLYSSGGDQGAQPLDLGLQLVEQGLARVIPHFSYLGRTDLVFCRSRSYSSSIYLKIYRN